MHQLFSFKCVQSAHAYNSNMADPTRLDDEQQWRSVKKRDKIYNRPGEKMRRNFISLLLYIKSSLYMYTATYVYASFSYCLYTKDGAELNRRCAFIPTSCNALQVQSGIYNRKWHVGPIYVYMSTFKTIDGTHGI